MVSSNLDRIAQRNSIVEELKEELMKFDSPLAGGDGDGVFELTDISSQQLSQKFSHVFPFLSEEGDLDTSKYIESLDSSKPALLSPDQCQHLSSLLKSISEIREKVKLPPLKSNQISAGEILETFRVLFGEDYSTLAESTESAKVRILGDSLTRGMASTSDGGVRDPRNFLMAKILFDSMGIPLEESLALTQKEAFPYDRGNIDDPGMMGFVKMGLDQALSLFFADGSYGDFFPLSSDKKTSDEIEELIESVEEESSQEKRDRIQSSPGVVIGASASTTADVISDLGDLSDRTASTGRSFIEKNYAEVHEKLGENSVLDMMISSFGNRSSGQLGVFLFMLGANDLFAIGGEKRIVNSPKQDPIKFRENIREIAQKIDEAKFGSNFRSLFIAPFDVSAVLTPVQPLTRYADSSPIPEGSMILHHHELIEHQDGVLPHQVVFTPDDIAKMKTWQKEYTEILQEELGLKHGWQIIEVQKIFSNLVREIKKKPISVYNVPGYEKLSFSFRDLFSMDNQHPSPSGYLLLALLQQALLMEAGYALEGHEEFLKNLPTNSQEREEYILFWVEMKFGEIVKKDPSFYRPRRMEKGELFELENKVSSDHEVGKILTHEDYRKLFPLLSDEVIQDLLAVISSSEINENLDHHRKVEILDQEIDKKVGSWEKYSEKFNEILLNWAQDFIDHQYEIARVMDLNFKAFGGVSNDDYEGKRFGVVRNVRGLLDFDLAGEMIDAENVSGRLGIGVGLETNSLRLMGLTQNIVLDAGLRFGYGFDQDNSAEILIGGGIATKLGRIQYFQIFNEVRFGAQIQLDQINDFGEDIGSNISLTDQVRFLFTISDDLTGRDNSTQAFYLGVENLSHFLEITPGYLPSTLMLGGNFTYAY